MSVRFEQHGRLAEIVLDRPHRRNAIDGPLGSALGDAFERAGTEDGVDAVLFRGEGGAFCSGLDLGEFNADPKPAWMADWKQTWRRAHRAIFNCNKPIVGALERYAINGGAALLIACDFAVAGESAYLQVGEVQIGMAAPYNLAWLRLRHGEAVSARLALLGERIAGPELERLGIVTRSVSDDAVLSTARELAERLASYPAGAPARIKRTLRGYFESSIDDWFDAAIAHSSGGAAPPNRR